MHYNVPLVKIVGPKVAKTLGISALAGAASEGASQIIKKITGGQVFQIPNTNLCTLAQLSNLLTAKQIGDLARAHKTGLDMLLKVNQKQVGNGIGTILPSIGIPLVVDAIKGITGGGVKGRGAPRIGSSRGGAAPRIRAPPPFIGTWNGRGKKNLKWDRVYYLEKTTHSKIFH